MLLFLDTETTGLPKYSATDPVVKLPRVVQLAWSLYSSDGERKSRNSFIIYSDGLFHPYGLCQDSRDHD